MHVNDSGPHKDYMYAQIYVCPLTLLQNIHSHLDLGYLSLATFSGFLIFDCIHFGLSGKANRIYTNELLISSISIICN
jgi:hypothetical protein